MTSSGDKMLTRSATVINNSRNGRTNTNMKPPTDSSVTTTTTTGTKTTIGINGYNRRSSTITSDPGILCFHHCNVKVFCFVLPHICPNCKSELHAHGDTITTTATTATQQGTHTTNGNADNCVTSLTYQGAGNAGDNGGQRISTMMCMSTKLLPFRLPYPFVRASQSPCAIVLRPTTGDFLNDYNNSTDLHIAVTTSTGCVVEFDRHGLQRHRADNMPEWWQCLLVGDVPEPWYDYWDEVLMQICKQPSRWTKSHYDEDSHNCYTFILAFLQALGYEKLSAAANSKTSFCEKFIVPRTTTAGKYISLYRKLRTAGIYVHAQQQHQHHGQQKKHKVRTNAAGKNITLNVANTAKIPTSFTLNNNSSSNKDNQNNFNSNNLKNNSSSIIMRTSTLCTIEE